MKKLQISILFIFLILLSSCNFFPRFPREEKIKNQSIDKNIEIEEHPDIIKTANILVMGDMIFHRPITNAAKTVDGYDYTNIFEEISHEIERADIAVANFEGTVNPNREISGFPLFNFPKETIRDLKKVGFDMLAMSNNHCLDSGVEGLISTNKMAKENGLLTIGTYVDENRELATCNVNGINIGFLNYTDTLNGMGSLVNNREYLVDTFATNNIVKDVEKLKESCDAVVAIVHWGNEYETIPNNREISLNKDLMEAGCDIILGSHPHVLQRYEKNIVNGKEIYTMYSMGNAFSNQRENYLNKKGVETGVMVKFTINKNKEKTWINNFKLLPTYVNKYRDKDGLKYRIINLEDYLPGGKFYDITKEDFRKLAQDRYNDAKNILEVKND